LAGMSLPCLEYFFCVMMAVRETLDHGTWETAGGENVDVEPDFFFLIESLVIGRGVAW
jgi:hypothetical protein